MIHILKIEWWLWIGWVYFRHNDYSIQRIL